MKKLVGFLLVVIAVLIAVLVFAASDMGCLCGAEESTDAERTALSNVIDGGSDEQKE